MRERYFLVPTSMAFACWDRQQILGRQWVANSLLRLVAQPGSVDARNESYEEMERWARSTPTS